MNGCDLVIHINAISDKKLYLDKKQKNIIIEINNVFVAKVVTI